MKCCGREMTLILRDDIMAGFFYICNECMKVLCPEVPVQVTEIGRSR